MRMVIAGQTYPPESNGQAVFTARLAEGLVRLGHEVLVIVPSGQLRSACVDRGGVHVGRVAAISLSPWYPSVHITPLPVMEVNRLFDGFRPDIVHIQDHYPLSRSVLRAARKRDLPVMGTNHFLPENLFCNLPPPIRAQGWTEGRIERLLWRTMLSVFNQLDWVTTPTATAADILRRQNIQPPVYPVSCGVDLTRFYPNPNVNRAEMRRRYGLDLESTLLLYVGRVDHEKRLDVLLHALCRLGRDDVQLAIAGKGLHLGALRAMAHDLALGDRVVFLGYVPDETLPALLNSVDIFTMPSEAELQSIATLEAMATGRPVLAADACALPELVRNGVNGYLFRPGDAEDAARRIAQLVEERERWAAMGAASAAQVAPHSLENTLQCYDTLYRSLLVQRRVSALTGERTRRAGLPRLRRRNGQPNRPDALPSAPSTARGRKRRRWIDSSS